jgi:hypothetical protein
MEDKIIQIVYVPKGGVDEETVPFVCGLSERGFLYDLVRGVWEPMDVPSPLLEE